MTKTSLLKAIKQHETFIISAHVNPDPDALCSELAMAAFLRHLGKKPIIINDDEVPERYHFLPGVRKIRAYSPDKKINYDAAIVLDCGDLNRIGRVQECLDEDKALINIDHHVTNDGFGTCPYINDKASSTAEMLYDFFRFAGVPLTDTVAMLLYTGILTDTGSFRYENTTAHTLAVAAALRKFKFSAYKLYQTLYETMPLQDLVAFTRVISDFDVLYSGRVICVELSKAIQRKISKEFDLRDTIFRFLRSVKGVEVFVIFSEDKENITRVNFRSSGNVSVAKIAADFNGGGHKNASGCQLETGVPIARKKVLARIRKELEWKGLS